MHPFQVNLFQLYNMTSNVFDGDYENPSKCTIIAVFQKEHGPANKPSFPGLANLNLGTGQSSHFLCSSHDLHSPNLSLIHKKKK